MDIKGLQTHLEPLVPRFLEDLRVLAGIDSGTFDKSGVDEVAAILADRYVALGAALDIAPHELYGNTVTARFEGRGQGHIVLVGHTDTVYPLGTAASRPLRIAGDRAIGPGTGDMKAGDLAIVYAMDALLAQEFDDFASITVVHNSDEEIGSPGSQEIIKSLAQQAHVVLVLEAGRENGDIVSSRKGIVDFRVHVHGRSAHAGVNHDRGRSAAVEISHLVVALEKLNGTLPDVTLNVGKVQAGDRINVVPDYAFAQFEVRAFEMDHLEEMMRRVENIINQRTVEGTTAELVTSMEHYPMHRSPATEVLVKRAQSIAEQLGFAIGHVATGGASDGNVAAAVGCPVLDGLGPIGGAAHSPDEYVLIPSIVPRIAMLAGLIASLGADPVSRN